MHQPYPIALCVCYHRSFGCMIAPPSDGYSNTDSEVIPEGFVLVSAGSFKMVSSADEKGHNLESEEIQEIALGHSFPIKATEATQDQWEALMGVNPSMFFECGSDCPVEYINWWEALLFSNSLTEQEGFRPCYDLIDCNERDGNIGFRRVRYVTWIIEAQSPGSKGDLAQ